MHCNFQVPLPGLKVRTDNLVNGAEDIFSKHFICNYEISYPGNLPFVPFPFNTILTNSNLLKQNKTIKILTIGHTVRLNSASLKEICDALKVNNTIQDLQFDAKLICGGENLYLEIGNVLKINKKIKQLDIFTYKNNEGFQFFADVLKRTETLKSFKFSDPKMTLDVLQDLLNSVKINKSITEFFLTSCGIKSKTCHFVTTALAFDNKIKTLDLCGNPIGDEGVGSICNIFRTNNTISEICLGWCKITAKGVAHIADMLKVNSTLKYIYLTGNKFGDEGAFLILTALKSNDTVQTMDLDLCRVSENILEEIEQTLVTSQQIEK
jgi:hypothetical protein